MHEGSDALNGSNGFTESLDNTATSNPDLEPEVGNYYSRMEELFSDEEDTQNDLNDAASDSVEDEFVYNGQDAEPSKGYREQMREILSVNGEDEEDAEDEALVERSLLQDDHASSDTSLKPGVLLEAKTVDDLTDHDGLESERITTSPHNTALDLSSQYLEKDFGNHPILPSLFRLRSTVLDTPQHLSSDSDSAAVFNSSVSDKKVRNDSELTPRLSSIDELAGPKLDAAGLDAFRWTHLWVIGEYIFPKITGKAKEILGSLDVGHPTVIATNGLVCIGTDRGVVMVFDFQQRLKCICGNESSISTCGPVTSLALSHDHSFIVIGHMYGHIQLYDISKPGVPARTVPPITIAALHSGRQEGHLLGSRITQVGFIGGKNTAVVSADEHGLAFYHSLGKMLFIEASDVLRILGKYPERNEIEYLQSFPDKGISRDSLTPKAYSQRPYKGYLPRKVSAILDMAPLPLGTFHHSTDAYSLVAMLTPLKLVIVGLSPSPKTWIRILRDNDDDIRPESEWRGRLSWFPSTALSGKSADEESKSSPLKDRPSNSHPGKLMIRLPTLAYSWGTTLVVLSIFETQTHRKVKNKANGRVEKMVIGKLDYKIQDKIYLKNDILALEWLNANQILAVCSNSLNVYDTRYREFAEEVLLDTTSFSPLSSISVFPQMSGDVGQRIKVYKGRIFVLKSDKFEVGTLLTWADRVLSLVKDGHLLDAIDLTTLYYTGKAEGNKNGLPEDQQEMRQVTGQKLRELMAASARYVFSEERLTDDTHVTTDNRGVDRTSLFEGLVTSCIAASLALDDFDFIFEELFQLYDDSGISRIFMSQLEPFILDDTIHFVPPRITQRLITLHDLDGDLDAVERIIWHIDPECLDINQTILLCQKYRLFDALIYIYTTALHDYVSPIVELLQIIRGSQHLLKHQDLQFFPKDDLPDRRASNAYKIFNYLASILSGLSYPSGKAMSEEDNVQAQKEVYTFLFYGRSRVWPMSGNGRIILTADEDGDAEPTYPYARLLLRYNSEAFLNILDLAFENSYFNGEGQGVDRQIIVKILLEVSSSNDSNLTDSDRIFITIFLAHNIPKYPQYIRMTPTVLQKILYDLTSQGNRDTLEDRQLAAEYLLSIYNPHEMDKILLLFWQAGFSRILCNWYQQERKWASLLRVCLETSDSESENLISRVEDILDKATENCREDVPSDVLTVLLSHISLLLRRSIRGTASLMDRFAPSEHTRMLHEIGTENELDQYTYLKCLFGPHEYLSNNEAMVCPRRTVSTALNEPYRSLYVTLLCRFEPEKVISSSRGLPENFLDDRKFLETCERAQVYDAVIWKLNELSEPLEAIVKVESFSKMLSEEIAGSLLESGKAQVHDIENTVPRLLSVIRIGSSLCLERSQTHKQGDTVDSILEDMWYKLLSSEIRCAQILTGAINSTSALQKESSELLCLQSMRDLIQETFTGLVSASSSKVISFPNLFKRLVESTAQSRASSGSSYTEFQTILTSMLESYRFEGDILNVTRRLIGRTIHETLSVLVKERMKGRVCFGKKCEHCGQLIDFTNTMQQGESNRHSQIIFSPSGTGYHTKCLPDATTETLA